MIKKIATIFIKIMIIVMTLQLINIPISNAAYMDDIIKDGNKFINDGRSNDNQKEVVDNNKVKQTTSKIYNILLVIGIVLSVIIGGILGIQIMWGSIEQQVKAKEMLMPYVAGCVVIFGAFGIWKICVTVFSQLSS